MNIHWPNTPEKPDLCPWYILLIRTPGMIVLTIGRWIYLVGVFLTFGIEAFQKQLEDTDHWGDDA